MNSKLQVLDQEIGTCAVNDIEYICITDIARFESHDRTDIIIARDIRRNLAKVNCQIHTDAIKENLIPDALTKQQINAVYASEADLLNKLAISQMKVLLRSTNHLQTNKNEHSKKLQ